MKLVDVAVHGQQFDRRHAEAFEVVDRRLGREPEVGAAQFGRDARVPRREALDVHFVDHGVVPRRAQRTVGAPGERGIDDRRQRRVRRAVAHLRRAVPVGARRVGEQRRMPGERPRDDLRVGIEHDLRRVEPVTASRIPRPEHAEPVDLSRSHVGQVAVPDHVRALGQRHAQRFRGRVGRVEQAQLDLRRMFREQREVDARAIPCRAQRIRGARPHSHRFCILSTARRPRRA